MTKELPNGLLHDVALPADNNPKLEITDWLSLALKLLWVTLFVLKDILNVAYRTIIPPLKKSLEGQVVMVTGGGRGLGRGLAIGFSKESCKVAVVDVNFSNALNTAADISAAGGVAKAYICNVANPEEIRALREVVTSDLGPVDILVNNAGIIYGGDILEKCQERDISAVLEVNLMSHFWMMREFLPAMKARNSGHIVAIASASSFVGAETGAAYIASKFGVRGLMEVVRAELELRPDNNVQTTTVYPYFINTSADYVDRWKIRVPAISIDEVVDATIAGVRRNLASVFIPYCLQLLIRIIGLLPSQSFGRYKRVFFTKMTSQNKKD